MPDIEINIRPLEYGDAEAVERYASDERVAATTTIPHPYPIGGGEGFVKGSIAARERRESFPFAIVADGEMIGVIGCNGANFEARTIRIDYAIASSHWGKGIMTRVVALALDYIFNELKMETVISGCLAKNPASGRVLEKNGFTEIEQFVYTHPKFNGESARRFRLTKDEWLGNKMMAGG